MKRATIQYDRGAGRQPASPAAPWTPAAQIPVGPRWRDAWVLALLVLILATALRAETPATRPAIDAVARVGIVVDDMDRSLAFYTGVLDFQKLTDVEVAGRDIEQLLGVFGVRCRIVRVRLGSEELELTEFLAPRGREVPRDSRSNDRWFQHVAIITSDMDAAYARLRAAKVRYASSGPQRLPDWNRSAAGIKAFYFHDPDSHVLEVLQFPTGKGDAKWHASDRLFLGIDHTAIVVADTDRSIAFYRDTLGMKVAGTSENYGDEQEHLNNVFGAHLRITTLRAPSGPGVELLEYLAPRDGRPYPADARANDLFHWRTVVSAPDAAAVYRAAVAEHRTLVSSRPVTADASADGSTPSFIVRDPDGHAVQVVGR